ncbi:alpha-hydroxy-acid oxidizing protein [Marivivens donghaensis]|uniref:Alpha-hydroxy-acid oxidizing protein n=1 Tax=Marivivens donghaensis TaxID=1699413 RepID=A0ABX0VYA2_9RHOB|nr:alpha-hydroxy acid oxidase [Marivivens donghaensis]NIY73040.1 alpha-hydroxy-acid oxidizing protein [Marivivens donghaensis]
MSDSPTLPTTLRGYERAARERLDQATAAYFFGAAGDGQTAQRNLSDLAEVQIFPRHLREIKGGGTRCTMLGQNLDAPIIVAPMAAQQLLHSQGETATAAAATAQGCGMVLSTQSNVPMENVRAEGPNARTFQLYWQGRDATLALAQRATDAGFQSLVLTVDAPVNGVRDEEIASGFQFPASLPFPNLAAQPPQFAPLTGTESAIFERIAYVMPTWDDVAWLCRHAPLPVLPKGIMHPGDVALEQDAGAAGLIVSNHGGRVLDGVPSSISALPAIRQTAGADFPVLFDGGIRRGVDIFRAIALGADAVLIGRPVLFGLAVGGALGVSHVLRLLRDELEITMALAGCRTLGDITRDCVRVPDGFIPY